MLCVLCLLVFSNSFLSSKFIELVWTNSVIKNIISVMRERSVLVKRKCKIRNSELWWTTKQATSCRFFWSRLQLCFWMSLCYALKQHFCKYTLSVDSFVVTPSNSLSNLPQYPPDIQSWLILTWFTAVGSSSWWSQPFMSTFSLIDCIKSHVS